MSISVSVNETIGDLIGERFSTAEAVRAQHGRDEFWHGAELPDAVVFPQSTEEVAEIVKICAASKTPLIPFGVGTSVEGHIQAVQGGHLHGHGANEPGPVRLS